ncbi:TolC family protein [uncultured Massilia sp.]|uniref:TolC family protein n=1 Tax=uncultured Massilia sp. TaxID=169973 RepID=UPI0025EB53F7|nr:TolC family protein [uncultured Massilia sp.]
MQSMHLVLGAALLSWQAAVPAAHAMGQQSVSTSPPALTLERAVAMAMAANPSLRAATRAVGIADGAVLQAGARPNPELSVSTEGTERRTRTETAQLSQVLELGGKRAARVAVARQERGAALAQVAVRRAELRADVVAAYLDALTAQERQALALAAVDLAHRATLVTGRRVAAGKLSPVEETRSAVAEAGARLDLEQARADLALSRRRLAALWGATAPFTQALDEPDAALLRLPPWDDLQARLEDAPQLRAAHAALDGHAARAQLERTRRVPDVTLSVGAQRERDAGRSQGVLGVAVPLPLFDRNQGNLLAALRRTDQARDELEAERLRLRAALADAYERAQLAAAQQDALRERIVPAAQGAYDAAVTGFELGKFAFTDVLDAQRTLFQARTQALRALADRYRALAELQRLVPTRPADADADYHEGALR